MLFISNKLNIVIHYRISPVSGVYPYKLYVLLYITVSRLVPCCIYVQLGYGVYYNLP